MFIHIVVLKFALKGDLQSFLKMEFSFPNHLFDLLGFVKVALSLMPGLIQYAIFQNNKGDEY